MSYVFQKISQEARTAGIRPGTVDSRDWFRDRASEVSSVNAQRLMRSQRANLSSNLAAQQIGQMFMFFYDPKLKHELPYYDKFPLIFMIEKYADGFLGINFHYLPLLYRARLMDALYSTANGNENDMMKLQIQYKILKSASKFKYFNPAVKRYLNAHVRSRFLFIPYDQWDTALFLPTERFAKANKRKVWDESRKIITRI